MMPYFKDESLITMDHKYVRITYLTTDEVASAITLKNNAGVGSVTLVPNTSESKGKWVTSAPVSINTGGLLGRFDAFKYTVAELVIGAFLNPCKSRIKRWI